MRRLDTFICLHDTSKSSPSYQDNDQNLSKYIGGIRNSLDWLQSLKHFFINVSSRILVASLTLMALF